MINFDADYYVELDTEQHVKLPQTHAHILLSEMMMQVDGGGSFLFIRTGGNFSQQKRFRIWRLPGLSIRSSGSRSGSAG